MTYNVSSGTLSLYTTTTYRPTYHLFATENSLPQSLHFKAFVKASISSFNLWSCSYIAVIY